MAKITDPLKRHIARLKRELYSIEIGENRPAVRPIRLAASSSPETVESEIPIRLLISKDRQRFFMEYNSREGLLNLVDFFHYEYDRESSMIIPSSCLDYDATYDLDEKGNITKIYLDLEESLTSAFRPAGEGIIEKVIRRGDGKGFLEKRLKLVTSQQTSYLVLS